VFTLLLCRFKEKTMARLNRPTFPFIGLLIAIGSASGVGCGFDTHGSPIDTTSTGATGGSGGVGGEGGMAGMGGMGGMAGAGGAMVCKPATTEPCYSGPANTPNIGICIAGKKTCLADGTGYGACEGEVVPTLENCVMVGDEDCDGLTDLEDSECKCTTAGAETPCDTGLLGVCRMGTGVCSADGRAIDPCTQTTKPTPENCATLGDDDCDGVMAAACTGDPKSTFTTAGTKDDAIFSVALTADGGSVIAGVVDGTIAADGTTVTAGTVYVAKLDATGAMQWSNKYPCSTYGAARGVATDPAGNVIVVGEFEGTVKFDGTNNKSSANNAPDIFMFKLDGTGKYVWDKVIGTTNDQVAADVATDSNGNILMTGFATNDPFSFGGSTFDPDNDDVFIVKFDTNGGHLWSNLFINAGSQKGRRLTVTNNGDVIIIGDTGDDINLGGGTITKGGNLDIFVARYGNDGTYAWSKRFGKTMDQVGRDVAMTPDGNVLITGGFTGTIDWKLGTSMTNVGMSDVYVAKLDGLTGNYITHVNGGKTGTSIGSSVGSDAAGNVTVFGHFGGSINFGAAMPTATSNVNDTFLVKLKANDWSHVWTERYGTTGNQFGWSVAVAKDGSAVVGGTFDNQFEVPPNAIIPTTGGLDIFAVLTNP
jgi:hypothetical protein